jgi:hypothetical protein
MSQKWNHNRMLLIVQYIPPSGPALFRDTRIVDSRPYSATIFARQVKRAVEVKRYMEFELSPKQKKIVSTPIQQAAPALSLKLSRHQSVMNHVIFSLKRMFNNLQ